MAGAKTVDSTEPRWATDGIEQPWFVGEAVRAALSALRTAFGAVVVRYALHVIAAFVVVAGCGWFVASQLGPLLTLSPSAFGRPAIPPSAFAIVGAGALAALLIVQLGSSGLYESALTAVRKEPPIPGQFGRSITRFPRILVIHLFIAFCAIIPFGIFALPFTFAPFFLVDERRGLIDALRKSWRTSWRTLGRLWLLHLVQLPFLLLNVVIIELIVLKGPSESARTLVLLLAAAIPLLGAFTIPLHVSGLAFAYARMTGRSDLASSTESASQSLRSVLKLAFATFAVMFGGLVAGVMTLPTLRGAAWSLKDTIIRASAIVSGVFAVILLLALLLPYGLDRLEGSRFTSFVAARHVRSQKSGFLTVISILSICGVAISSCALSSVVSVMGGFSQDLKRKILGNNAHIVIDTTAGIPFADYDSVLERIRAVPGVVGAAPVVHGEVMASSASNLAGVIVKGVDPPTVSSVIDLSHNLEVGKLDYLEHPDLLTHLPPNEVIGIGPGGEPYYKGPELAGLGDDIDPAVRAVILNRAERPGIILGRELAKTLHVYVGDEITLVSPLGDLGPMGIMPRTKKFRVAGIFYSGMYEYDATYVYTMIDAAQEYFQTDGKIHAIEVKIDDAERAERVTPKVEEAVGRTELRVRDWREINKNLFSALKLERFATFIILSIAILVASFCIVCTLLLMVTEKGKEIAILKAIGASDGAILRTFMLEGMIIGGIGTTFGVVTGLAVCTGLSWFGLRLDPDVYYIDRLPISVNGIDFFTVAVAAFTICTLSTIYPAYAASKLRPVDGLRYE